MTPSPTAGEAALGDRAPGAGAPLAQWLRWQRSLNPATIELGLGRCRRVAARAALDRPAFKVITVAGTNGKGSCAVMIEALLRSIGLRVGTYLSPHLLRYNERVRLDGHDISSAALCAANAAVERVRGAVPLTFFEFGTLAAMRAFADARVDCAVLEVGLGGRLDAVNTFAADVAILTSLDLDHAAWLGATRDAVAREKAGVMRRARPAVCADPAPPPSLFTVAREVGADLRRLGSEFGFRETSHGRWEWWGGGERRTGLARPALRGAPQLRNAAAALAAVQALEGVGLPPVKVIDRALARLRLRGRIEVRGGAVERVFDVAHNPAAARELAAWLDMHPRPGSTRAVCGMLADKDAHDVVAALAGVVDEWWWVGLGGERGRESAVLRAAAGDIGARHAHEYGSVAAAWPAVLAASQPGDRVLALGSFRTVRAALRADRCGG